MTLSKLSESTNWLARKGSHASALTILPKVGVLLLWVGKSVPTGHSTRDGASQLSQGGWVSPLFKRLPRAPHAVHSMNYCAPRWLEGDSPLYWATPRNCRGKMPAGHPKSDARTNPIHFVSESLPLCCAIVASETAGLECFLVKQNPRAPNFEWCWYLIQRCW